MFEKLLERIRTGMTTRADAYALAPLLNCVAEIARGAYTAQSCPLALAVLCQTARGYAARAQDCEHGFTVSCPEGCN